MGKTTDLTRRRGTYETISTEPLTPYAQIETTDENEVETFMKHRLQSRRWPGGKGRELYEVNGISPHTYVPCLACIIEVDKEYGWRPWTRLCERASTS